MKLRRAYPAGLILASALSVLPGRAGAQIGGIARDSAAETQSTPTESLGGAEPGITVGGSAHSDLIVVSIDVDLPILGFGSTTLGGSRIRPTSTSSLTAPSSLLGPLDLGANPPFSSFGRFLPGVGPNASGTRPSPRLPVSALGSTRSSLGAPTSLLGPLDLGTNPPFSSFGRFLPGVGENASGTRPAPRLRAPGAAPSAAATSGGVVVWDSFCDPQDFTCGQ